MLALLLGIAGRGLIQGGGEGAEQQQREGWRLRNHSHHLLPCCRDGLGLGGRERAGERGRKERGETHEGG